tara:strand:- start:57 stop:1325 length:1269 start_codon:yes stop_codon:yes gene_type:complete
LKVLQADSHNIDPKDISAAAVKVTQGLKRAGYEGYIVGGAVRDLMLGGQPKDFDVATNATPEQIRQLFRSARIIGRRFQIVHVRFGAEIIEVTTYRGHHDSDGDASAKSSQSEKGLLLRDNVYGTLDEDAARRDLTVNAMYYDPDERAVFDHMQGAEDIQSRLVRIIGDPHQRYREDPVRMLRVVRFSARLQFDIESETEYAIAECAPLLNEIPAARLFDEFLKLFMSGYAQLTFTLLRQHKLLPALFPEPADYIDREPQYLRLVQAAMASTDRRVREQRPVTPAFLLAAILWPAVQARSKLLVAAGEPIAQAMNSAGQQVTAEVCLHVAIPKRFSIPMREMWEFQPKLERRLPKRIKDMLSSRRFRAAYDLLLLRESAGEELDNCGVFWTEQQVLFPDIVGSAPPSEEPPRRKRPRRRRAP